MYLKKISQDEFDALPVVDGIKKCPGFTDYSNVKSFGERCSFGGCCSFGERCACGDGCAVGSWYSFGMRDAVGVGRWCGFTWSLGLL